MKKNILLIAGFVLAFTAVSCSLEENAEPVVDSVVPMEFSADAPATRTAITDGNAVIWSEDDAISVFDGAGNHKFTAGTAGSTTTKFSGEAESGKETYYALYPYSADASLAGTTIHSVLPANQYSTADGTFDTMLAPAVAKAEENGNLIFHNVAGLVKFTFTGAGDRAVKSISMTADQSLTGSYSVDMSGEAFSAVATGSASAGETPAVSGITLTAKEGNLAAGPYYLVALPGTYTNVEISVVFDDNTYMTGSVSSLTINAGKIKPTDINLSEVDLSKEGLYGLVMAGGSIEIAGQSYSLEDLNTLSNGNIVHVTTDNANELAFAARGVYFIDSDVTVNYTYTGSFNKAIIIGNDKEKRSAIKFVDSGNTKNYIKLSAAEGHFACYNIDFDASQSTQYLLTNNFLGNFSYIAFDNCHFFIGGTSPLMNLSISESVSRGFDTFVMNNCVYESPASSGNRYIIATAANHNSTITNLTFENNIFYCNESNGILNNFKLFNGKTNVITTLTIGNNTFYNTLTNNEMLVRSTSISNFEIQGNLYYSSYSEELGNANVGFLRVDQAADSRVGIAQNNIAFYPANTNYGIKIFNDNHKTEQIQEITRKRDVNPFEGDGAQISLEEEIFIPTTEYASYGAQR